MSQPARQSSGNRRHVKTRRSGGPGTQRPTRRRTYSRRLAGAIPRAGKREQPRSDPASVGPPGLRMGPVALVSALLGATTGMVIAGLAMRFREVFSQSGLPSSVVTGAVTGTALLSLAIGVRVP